MEDSLSLYDPRPAIPEMVHSQKAKQKVIRPKKKKKKGSRKDKIGSGDESLKPRKRKFKNKTNIFCRRRRPAGI
jgi:hypothetical protein